MKNYQTNKWLIQLLVVLVAVVFYSAAQAQRVNHNVEVQLNEHHTVLDVNTRGRCANDNHAGCIEVAHMTQGRFNFSFTGNKTCNLMGGRRWVMGEVYLGGKNSPTKPGSSDWGGFQNDAEVKADFNLADELSGRLVKEAGSNQNSIVIFDDNITLNGYDIWYKLTADCIDNGGNVVDSVETDPRIKNGGAQ